MLMLGRQLARKPHNLLLGFSITGHDGQKPLPSGPQYDLRRAITALTRLF
jgi:hypothetical protein